MYISLADFKRDLGIPSDNTTKDEQLTDFIERAQAVIENHCRRKFEASTNTTRYLHAVDDVHGLELWLDKDLASINSITNGDGTTITSGQYTVIPVNAVADGKPIETIRLKQSAGVSWTFDDDPEGAIAISGKWAYSASPPSDVIQATFRLAGYFFQQKDNASDIDRPMYISAGGNTTVLPPRLPDDLKKLLVPYVRSGIRT